MQVCRFVVCVALAGCGDAVVVPDLRVGTPCPAVVMRELNDKFIATHPGLRGPSWQHAVYLIGDLAAATTVGEPLYVDYALGFADVERYELIGDIETRNPDNHAAGQVYFSLYTLNRDPARIAEISKALDRVIRDGQRDFWATADSQFFASPAFAQIGSVTGDPRYIDTAFQLFMFARDTRKLFDPEAGLWFRDLESRFPQHKNEHDKKIFWSRANGFVIASIARTLPYLPLDSPYRPIYEAHFRTMAAAIAPLQRPDGFWNVNLADNEDHPGPESSGTSLFTFALAWGINAGMLDFATYAPIVERAWLGMNTIAVRADRELGYVQGEGETPSDDQPVSILSTADFGLGLFLLAGSEVAKLDLDLGCP